MFLLFQYFEQNFIFSSADKLNQQREKLAKGALSWEEKMKIYEKMGDISADVGQYKTSIKYYHKMVSIRGYIKRWKLKSYWSFFNV